MNCRRSLGFSWLLTRPPQAGLKTPQAAWVLFRPLSLMDCNEGGHSVKPSHAFEAILVLP